MKKTILLMAAIFASFAPLSLHAASPVYQPGHWSGLVYDDNQLIGGMDFNVSNTGTIKGRSVFNLGAVLPITGRVTKTGSFTVTRNEPAYDIVTRGTVSRKGTTFTARTKGGTFLVRGSKIGSGQGDEIYTGITDFGRLIVVLKPIKTAGRPVTILTRKKFVLTTFAVGGRFSAETEEKERKGKKPLVSITGTLKNGQITGIVTSGVYSDRFTLTHL